MKTDEYHRVLRRDGTLWAAEVVELPGCYASGDTPDEAVAHLEAAMADWMSGEVAAGHAIPEPIGDPAIYSGRVTLRLPPSIHRRAVMRATIEKVSLNRLLSAAVAVYVGERSD